MTEVWKDIVGYEGLYRVSSLGNVKSLSKIKMHLGMYHIKTKERILKPTNDKYGYLIIDLHKNNNRKNRKVHQLVAESFLNYTNYNLKLVVNHINFIKYDNRIENLEIITFRENTNKKHIKSSSQYVGVHWNNRDKKWISKIQIAGKSISLGYFNCELEASNAYQNELKKINI